MFPPTDFPKPTPAFQSPIPVPTADPDAGTQWCVSFNQDYLPMVVGALLELTNQATWDTSDPDAQLLAQERAMSLIALFQTGVDCMGNVMIEACDSPDCGIKYSTDGGTTWTCINLGGCIADIVGTGIDNAINDGLLQKAGGQPSPTSAPAPGSCQTYHVILAGNERWKIPSPLNQGDSITVTNAKGGWTDGSLFWFCWNGESYTLGACGGNNAYEAGDPVQAGNHMMLIGGYNTTTPVYFDARTEFIMPIGISAVDGWLQANDTTLDDNAGQIEFDVQICSWNEWCHQWDFTATQESWGAAPATSWTLGTGYTGGYASSNDNTECQIHRYFTAQYISHVEMTYSRSAHSGPDANVRIYLWISGSYTAYSPVFTSDGNNITVSWDVTPTLCDHLSLDVNAGNSGGSTKITHCLARGRGASQFGTDNCV